MVWRVVAVAVAGSAEKPCEDAAFAASEGDLVVVADGLGSTGLGAAASQQVVGLAEALRTHVHAGAPLGGLGSWVRDCFGAAVEEDPRMATTALWALATPSRVVVGRVGDGLVAIKHVGGEVELLEGGRGEFANETAALPRTTPEFLAFHPAGIDAVLLATDGVADDLLPGSEGDLLSGFAALLRREGEAATEAVLRSWLVNWATPRSHDDRSVALLVRLEGP